MRFRFVEWIEYQLAIFCGIHVFFHIIHRHFLVRSVFVYSVSFYESVCVHAFDYKVVGIDIKNTTYNLHILKKSSFVCKFSQQKTKYLKLISILPTATIFLKMKFFFTKILAKYFRNWKKFILKLFSNLLKTQKLFLLKKKLSGNWKK